MQRVALAVTAINFGLLVFGLSQVTSTTAQTVTPTVPRTLELVDDRAQVRSRLTVESDGAVVLRLFDEKGTIRVKLAADEDGSGFLLLDEATEPGVHMIARRSVSARKTATTNVTLTGADGQQRVIKP